LTLIGVVVAVVAISVVVVAAVAVVAVAANAIKNNISYHVKSLVRQLLFRRYIGRPVLFNQVYNR
jgi:hypothetical protein